jgi:hypothetical protein
LRSIEMKNVKTTKNSSRINDIERAAWYARLAFGIYSESGQPPAAPAKRAPVFNVIP